MRLARHCRAPVERYFSRHDKRFGFLRPKEGSDEVRHTKGEDVFFHLDEFSLPLVTPNGVDFGKQTPTPEQIREAEVLLERGRDVIFDLQRTSRGFMADPWCPIKLWNEAVLEWERLYPSTPTTITTTHEEGASR